MSRRLRQCEQGVSRAPKVKVIPQLTATEVSLSERAIRRITPRLLMLAPSSQYERNSALASAGRCWSGKAQRRR